MAYKLHTKSSRLVRRGIRKYVKLRTTNTRAREGRHGNPSSKTKRNNEGTTTDLNYHPSRFRHTPPSNPPELPRLALEIPDFELWINELWHDFLIEPTPYLVASAICYLGGVLILVQYYVLIWRLLCFFSQFIPWDDEFGLG